MSTASQYRLKTFWRDPDLGVCIRTLSRAAEYITAIHFLFCEACAGASRFRLARNMLLHMEACLLPPPGFCSSEVSEQSPLHISDPALTLSNVEYSCFTFTHPRALRFPCGTAGAERLLNLDCRGEICIPSFCGSCSRLLLFWDSQLGQ